MTKQKYHLISFEESKVLHVILTYTENLIDDFAFLISDKVQYIDTQTTKHRYIWINLFILIR
jgi:hypothetical protein